MGARPALFIPLAATLLVCTITMAQPTLGADTSKASAAVSAALQAAKSAEAALSSEGGAAAKSCVENIGNSASQLSDSVKQFALIKGPESAMNVDNIKTWASAALTSFGTCSEGADELSIPPEAKAKITAAVSSAEKLTSEALKLVNEIQL